MISMTSKDRYTVTLDKQLVERAKTKMDYTGGKLSPIINRLLEVWLDFPDDVKNILTKSKTKKEDTLSTIKRDDLQTGNDLQIKDTDIK